MRWLLGLATCCLITLAGCGGSGDSDEPTTPSLDGPATIEAVAACLDSSPVLAKDTYVRNTPATSAQTGFPFDTPPVIQVSFKGYLRSENKSALINFATSEANADQWMTVYAAFLGEDFARDSMLVKASVPTIILQYSPQIDTNDLAVLQSCTKEP